MKDLLRMKLISDTSDLETQQDFVEMSTYHDHSRVRHQRKSETKRQYRRRMRNILKAQRRQGLCEILSLQLFILYGV